MMVNSGQRRRAIFPTLPAFPDTARILRHAGVGKRPAKSLADQRLEFSDTIFPTPGRRQNLAEAAGIAAGEGVGQGLAVHLPR
ncbi:MAG: hypothetical protein K9G48_14845, partial [Reyranella sp.]|nr:hypothetical protein [Reyranella sp.]